MNELLDEAIAQHARRSRRMRAIGLTVLTAMFTPAGYALAMLGGVQRELVRAAVAVPIGGAIVLTGFAVVRGVQWVSGRAVESIMVPGGPARDTRAYSQAQSLAAAGRLEEAAAAFDAMRAERGDDSASLRAEAEFHAAPGRDPQRAAVLLQQLRRLPEATASDELYATHRLIDLYLGVLNDKGRVMVELLRMADRFPDTIDGQGALAELRRRREELQSPNGDSA